MWGRGGGRRVIYRESECPEIFTFGEALLAKEMEDGSQIKGFQKKNFTGLSWVWCGLVAPFFSYFLPWLFWLEKSYFRGEITPSALFVNRAGRMLFL